jgi:hypothetical protein
LSAPGCELFVVQTSRGFSVLVEHDFYSVFESDWLSLPSSRVHFVKDVDHNVLHVRFLLGHGFSPFGGCSTSSGCGVANTRGRLAGSHGWRSFSAGVPFIRPHLRHSCHVKPSGRIQSWSVIIVVPSMVGGRLLLMCLMTQRYRRGKRCCYNLLRTWYVSSCARKGRSTRPSRSGSA